MKLLSRAIEGMTAPEDATLASFSAANSMSRSSMDVREFETPRDSSGDLSSPVVPIRDARGYPLSPSSVRKTKSRAGRGMNRYDSLREAKLLMVTDLRRSDSMLNTDLFSYNSNFERLGIIGQTKTSEVFKVRHRQTGEIFAVKRSRRRFRTKLQRERCLREIRAVAELSPHPNIVSQYRAWQEGGHFYLQMDYCSGGSLHQMIQSSGPLSDVMLWGVAFDIASGLDFLHKNSILHLDIKPENIYRGEGDNECSSGSWRIGDFGLAVAKETQDWEEGDGDYVGPELLKSDGELTPYADIFSLGATLYECATGEKLPRQEGSANAADIELPGRPQNFLEMVKAMLQSDPSARPSAGQLAAFASVHQSSSPYAIGTSCQKLTHDPSQRTVKVDLRPDRPSRTAEANISSHLISSLSPFANEGNLTPSAADGLMGLTPESVDEQRSNRTAAQSNAHARTVGNPGNVPNTTIKEVNYMRKRPPALKIPSMSLHFTSLPNTARTSDTNGSFRIRRRDVLSPGSEAIVSPEESEGFSYSCETTGSAASDLEFPDVPSPGSGWTLPSTSTNGIGGFRRLSSFSMGKDMHASPEWTVNGSPTKIRRRRSLSADNSPESTSKTVHGSQGGQNRYKVSSSTLVNDNTLEFTVPDAQESDCSEAGLTSKDRMKSQHAIHRRIRATAAQQRTSPFENHRTSEEPPESHYLAKGAQSPGRGVPPVIIPPLVLPLDGRHGVRRKRQHSSRRPLVSVLKESNNYCNGGDLPSNRSLEVCSSRTELCSSRSIEQLMPVKKGARHGGAHSVCVNEHNIGGEHPIDDYENAPGTERSLLGKPHSARTVDIVDEKCIKDETEACCANTAAMQMTIMTLDDGNLS